MIKIFSFLFLLIFISFSSNKVLDPVTLQEMYRLKGKALSPDGKYLVYSVNKWSNVEKKSFTNLRYFNLETNEEKNLTDKENGQSDTSPVFSSKFPNILFFMRNNKSLTNTLFYMKFPPEENKNEEPIQLSNYQINIETFKIKNDVLVFSAEVFFECQNKSTNFSCTDYKNEEEKKKGYKIYNNLFAFHWDHWLTEGKGSHLFYQKLKYNDVEGKFNELEEDPLDITLNMSLNSPPLFTDNSMYDISNDGNKVAFVAHTRNENEAFSAEYNIYFFDIEEDNSLLCISDLRDKFKGARTLNPKFFNNDSYISYLAMKTKGLESEFKHFEFYDIQNNSIIYFEDDKNVSPNDYLWINDFNIIFQADYYGTTKLFSAKFDYLSESTSYEYEQIKVKNESSFSLPLIYNLSGESLQLIVEESAYNHPTTINLLNGEENKELVNLNKEIIKDIELPQHISFTYESNGDDIQGWFIPPVNYDPEGSVTYPLVVFIHGGPEQSWTSTFSFYWSPQIFAAQGYASILINFHGSTGVTSEFQNSVRDNWGEKPYSDIMNGVKYILNTYKNIDKEKIVAMGGSYGGYMINWIEGHNNDTEFNFKCLVNHDGIFYNLGMFYETDEIWFVKAELCTLNNIECNPFDSEDTRNNINKYSPENEVKNWKTPMLIIHGNNDYRVSLTQGLSTFTALRLNNVDAKLIYYPLENHWVVSNVDNQVIWLKEIITWFKKYAPPEEEDSSSESFKSDSSESFVSNSSESFGSDSEISDSSKSKSDSSKSKSVSSSHSSSSSSSSSSNPSSSDSDGGGIGILEIILIILGIIFVVLLVVFIVFKIKSKHIKNDQLEKDVKKADLIM